MNLLKFKRHCAFFISLSFLFPSPLLLSECRYSNNISPDEVEIILDDVPAHYVYLGKDASEIHYVVEEISLLDEFKDSPIHVLHKYLNCGYTTGEINDVGSALEYGELVLNRKGQHKKKTFINELRYELKKVLQKVCSGELDIDPQTVHEYKKCSEILESLTVLKKALFTGCPFKVIDTNK